MNVLTKGVVALQNKAHVVASKIGSKAKEQEGASTVEYALVLAVIVLGVISAGSAMFEPMEAFFRSVVAKVAELVG